MEKNCYSINELAVISGFTTRSLRNFISMGHLNGEKVDGVWQFTPMDIENFLSNPNVAPGIKTKANTLVYDFISDSEKKSNQICSIMDYIMNDDEAEELSQYFCNQMNKCSSGNFKFEKHGKNVRVIIRGPEDFVIDTIKGWYK
ncbi:MAG: helix-turn-helix domain-containing protein [Treponema sp.]|nr:helix-turn-helix domain-containing protein [Treponema sp.]